MQKEKTKSGFEVDMKTQKVTTEVPVFDGYGEPEWRVISVSDQHDDCIMVLSARHSLRETCYYNAHTWHWIYRPIKKAEEPTPYGGVTVCNRCKQNSIACVCEEMAKERESPYWETEVKYRGGALMCRRPPFVSECSDIGNGREMLFLHEAPSICGYAGALYKYPDSVMAQWLPRVTPVYMYPNGGFSEKPLDDRAKLIRPTKVRFLKPERGGE